MRANENILYDSNKKIFLKTYHSIVKPGKRVLREHHHVECELSLIVSGSGIYNVSGAEYSFSAGDMFLFGSDEAHCITDITSSLNILNIHFEPRILWEHSDCAVLLNIFTNRNKNFKNMFLKNDTTLQTFITDIENEMITQNQGYKIKIQYSLFSALIHIIRTYDYTKSLPPSSPKNEIANKLIDAIAYIDNNLEKNLTLKEIASHACMVETYFSSIFKKFNGISPWKYITIKRVEKAIDLIQNTNMTKLEIAEKCGFSTSSNFYKAFFNITGKKPSDYMN